MKKKKVSKKDKKIRTKKDIELEIAKGKTVFTFSDWVIWNSPEGDDNGKKKTSKW